MPNALKYHFGSQRHLPFMFVEERRLYANYWADLCTKYNNEMARRKAQAESLQRQTELTNKVTDMFDGIDII